MFSLLGICVMLSANNFLVVYLGLELMSLSLYALVGAAARPRAGHRGGDEVLRARRAGQRLPAVRPVDDVRRHRLARDREVFKAIGTGQIKQAVLVFGVVFVVAGLAFKLGAVPFHMWMPDVYQGAPTAVTVLVGGAPKLAAFAITIRLLVEGMSGIAQSTGSRC